jgi:hypothetical protein
MRDATTREVLITAGDGNKNFVVHLARSEGRFLITGSTATHFHVPEREMPGDLDIVVEQSAEMAAKLEAAFAHVGAQFVNIPVERFTRPFVHLRCKDGMWPTYMDIFTPAEGVDFLEHWEHADEAFVGSSIGRAPVRVASSATMQMLLRLGIERERGKQPEKVAKYERDLALLEAAARRRG